MTNLELLETLLINRSVSEVLVEHWAERDIPDAEFDAFAETYLTDDLALQAFLADNPGASLPDWDADGNYIG